MKRQLFTIIGLTILGLVTQVQAADAKRPSATTFAPVFLKWMKDVEALPARMQVEAVAKKLQELNPGFNGKVTGRQSNFAPKIENGVVTEFGFAVNDITDLSPVRALVGLRALCCFGNDKGGTLSDLSPL